MKRLRGRDGVHPQVMTGLRERGADSRRKVSRRGGREK